MAALILNQEAEIFRSKGNTSNRKHNRINLGGGIQIRNETNQNYSAANSYNKGTPDRGGQEFSRTPLKMQCPEPSKVLTLAAGSIVGGGGTVKTLGSAVSRQITRFSVPEAV